MQVYTLWLRTSRKVNWTHVGSTPTICAKQLEALSSQEERRFEGCILFDSDESMVHIIPQSVVIGSNPISLTKYRKCRITALHRS